MPCNFNNRVLAAKVKEGIRAAGGTPMELNTIAISDGITMGTAGHARLAGLARGDRRLDRARRLRPPVRRARHDLRLRQDDPRHGDGARAPGHPRADALRRLDPARPLVKGAGGDDPAGVRGGRASTPPARSPRRSCTSWRRSPRRAPAPAAASSPRTRWRWPSRRSASRRPARRWCPPRTGASSRSRRSCGELVMDVLRSGQRPSDVITKPALENAIAAVATSGGSTNGVLHLLAVAREMGVPLDDRRVRARSPSARRCCATCSRAGATSRPTCTRPAACRSCSRRLKEAGILNEDAQTVTGRTIGEHADEARETRRPARRAAALGAAQTDRRLRDPARQRRARRLRRQARRARAPQAHRARRACSTARRPRWRPCSRTRSRPATWS